MTEPAKTGDNKLQQAMKAVDASARETHSSTMDVVDPGPGPFTFVKHQDPTEEILEERQKVHGDFSDDAQMAQALKRILRTASNWENLSHVQRESLEMICTKLGRIMVGNPHHKDHWDDIAGYARLVAQRLP